jgi:hypothetical protein
MLIWPDVQCLGERDFQEAAQERLFCEQFWLVTAASGRGYLQRTGKRHAREAASQLSRRLFPRLATMESNSEFNKEFMYLRFRSTYSLQ